MRIIPHTFLIQKSPSMAQYTTQTWLINSTANVEKYILHKSLTRPWLTRSMYPRITVPCLFRSAYPFFTSQIAPQAPSLRKRLLPNTFLSFCSHLPLPKKGCLNPFIVTSSSYCSTRLSLSPLGMNYPPLRTVNVLTRF